ncbi:MAG: 3-phosphoshikimate 1-carboxyvinyltransferase [Panacagrimonas sp.]
MSDAAASLNWTVEPGGKPTGTVRVPGDKSISHRSVMLGSLAEGVTEITGFLDGEDCLCTMKSFQAMGVRIERLSDTSLRVHGVGLHGLKAPSAPLDLGNSGTSMRLMSGLMAAQKFPTTLIGDESLSRRPMRRVIDPLAKMGARIESNAGMAPLRFHPVTGLHGISHASKVASAQVKSCILLAGLYAEGRTTVAEPEASRDHTERMLQAFGVKLEAAHGHAAITGGQKLIGTNIPVPADISSAAFFLMAAAIVPGSDVLLKDVGINPTRTGVIDILLAMGASIELLDPRTLGGEPVADLRVRGQGLRGIAVDPALVASAIDEFPAIFVAAACAEGDTLVTGAEELRVKESDRIQTMVDGLSALGIQAEATPDGARIRGGQMRGGEIHSHGDHRVAMSFAMAALRASGPISVLDVANVNTSFPGFARLAAGAGLKF